MTSTGRRRDIIWDPDEMISRAKSLQRVANKLDGDWSQSVDSDPVLFTGLVVSGPILLSLATEIALKAWHCRERKQPPQPTHDLFDLFNGLEADTRAALEERMPGWSWVPRESPYAHGSLPDLLWSHRDAHNHWRYSHETPSAMCRSGELNQALTVIIEAYEKTRPCTCRGWTIRKTFPPLRKGSASSVQRVKTTWPT